MVSIGQQAPGFDLPGTRPAGDDTFSLRESVAAGNAVLLLFYPFDFSPVCTDQLCAMRDAEWFRFAPDIDVRAISGDSVHAHRAFREEYDLNFPLLSDFDGSVAASYDARYDRWEGHRNVPKRAAFVVDRDQVVRYRWVADDAYEMLDLWPVRTAIEALDDSLVPGGVDTGGDDVAGR